MEHSSFALTRTQSRTLAHAAAGPNLCAVYRIDGRPDVERLSAAVAQLVAHCRPLAYRLVEAEQGMRWVIRRDVRAELNVIDLDGRDTRDEAAVLSLIDGLCARTFRMDAGLPWAFTLLRAGARSYLVFACHPALLDRFSLTPLFNALSRAYRGVAPGAPLGIDQQGLLDAERELLASERLQTDLDFWIGQVGDASFEWHAPRRQNALADSSFSVRLDAQTGAALRNEAKALGVAPDLLIKLCVHVLLRRMTGSRAVLTVHHQRGRCQRDETIGFDERRRLLKTDFDDTMTLRQFLRHAAVRAEMADFHAELPAFEVQHDIERREPGFVRATNVVCETDSLPYDALTLGTLPAALLAPYSRRFSHEDVGVYLDVREEIALHVHSRHPQELDGLRLAFEHLTALLGRVGESLEQKLDAIDLYTPALRQHCAAWSDGGPLAAPARDVLDLFAQAAHEHAEHPAVSGPDAAFTYAQLALATQRVGAALAAREPDAPDRRDALVGICVSRGACIVPAMFGVLASGAGYLPLDPQMPDERLRYVVKDSQLRAVIVDAATHERLSALADCALYRIEDLLKGPPAGAAIAQCPPADPQRTAYVIYTSGTTGKPKGVVIERGMLAHLIASLAGRYRRDASTRWLQFASINFDASVLEIFNPLMHGGHLIVAPEAVRTDADALSAFLNAERVTHAFLPPAILKLLPRRALPHLDTVLCGGEASDDETIRFWSGVLRLSNIYGPTETTVMATENTFDGDKPANQLGHPLPGYQIHLLDEEGEAVPLGGIGEICIGGAAVSRGYLLRPELTGQKFRANPFGPGRLYRTGDLGRFLADGTIEYFGRNDAQIKLRGFRIELGEIENCIAAAPGVAHAACRVWGEGEARYLAAYYVAAPGEGGAAPDEDTLRRHVAQALPDYMVPACFIRLDALPASPNGKHDRQALPAPSRAGGTPPREGVEQRIAEIWQTLLRVSGIARDDSFFRLGGNSILAVRMQAQLRDALGIQFPMAAFYRSPTIATLADGGHEDMIERAIADASQPFVVEQAAPAFSDSVEAAPIRTMLLTGASGFLGIYLLYALTGRLDKVICLQRCPSAAAGRAVLQDKAREAGLAIDFSRVDVIPADLAAPQLGLDTPRWRQLAGEVDAILHCGAFVHHLHSYEAMKGANVGGTEALLRLALTQRQKPFCFISTLSVGEMLAGARRIDERVNDARPMLDNGYLLTKWVGEQRVAECARRFGLPAVIARPGNITGDSRTGFSNFAHNHFWLFNKGCLQLGAYPETAREVEMMPVDLLASAVTAVALYPRPGVRVANLNNPIALTQRQWFDALAVCGLHAEPQTAADWQRRLADLDASNGLALIRDFYTGDLSAGPLPVEQIGTLTELTRRGVDLTIDYSALIRLYVGYLRDAGFLDPVRETAA
ncbi:amino acid adenylation domain-containing protein [Paraburkholderia sediminicola]|uniref:amino acid adenylation domain-containing protein n=1 Tax=Paraburkholderia sediminicola TaxID=458836 RepID=UPI0038B9382F